MDGILAALMRGVEVQQGDIQGIPGEGIPGEGIPGEGIPGEGMSEERRNRVEGNLGEGIPGEGILGEDMHQETDWAPALHRSCGTGLGRLDMDYRDWEGGPDNRLGSSLDDQKLQDSPEIQTAVPVQALASRRGWQSDPQELVSVRGPEVGQYHRTLRIQEPRVSLLHELEPEQLLAQVLAVLL